MYDFVSNIINYALLLLDSNQKPRPNSTKHPSFKKGLAYKLMCRHQDLLQLFVDLKLCAQQSDSNRAVKLIAKFRKYYSYIVSNEQSEIYPFIENRICFNVYCDTIHNLRKLTNREEKKILHFCNYWSEIVQSPGMSDEFYRALDLLGESLDILITEKEMKLYPLYNQSASISDTEPGHKNTRIVPESAHPA